MVPELTQDELAAALDAVAAEALHALGGRAPPIDAVALAAALALRVAVNDSQPERGRFVRLKRRGWASPRGSILVRPEPRPERVQWAVAHEIGEHLAERVFALLGVDPREAAGNAREQVANQLASRLLLPTAWFLEAATACGWDLPLLKQTFSTASHELVARRMLDFSPPVVITVFDHGAMTFRRGNLPYRTPGPSAAELHCRHKAHELGRAEHNSSAAWTISAWPIHEPGWKREIVRMELTGMDNVEFSA